MSPSVALRRPARILAAITAVLLVAAGGTALWWYLGPHQVGTRFAAMFTQSVGIYPGSDVDMLGVPVGKVDAVTPEGTDVKVSMHLDRGVAVRADTRAVIISPSLVSDRYVQLTGTYSGGPKLQPNTVIPLARTETSVEIDQLTQGLVNLTRALGPNGANKHGAFGDLLNVGAANLRGNGTALNQMIDQLSRSAGTLADNRGDFFRTLDNLAKFTGTLAANNRSVGGLNSSLAQVSQVLATDRRSFTGAMHQLSGALLTVKNFINDNRALIATNVRKLAVVTQTLKAEQDALGQALRTAPLAVDNLINAYDPKHQTIDGRGNLNELSLWPTNTGSGR